MLIIDNLNKSYNKIILSNFCYKFEHSKIYAIKGPSGCGKTTLFNIIGLIDHEYDGDILLNDLSYKDNKVHNHILKNDLAHIFQDFFVEERLTVLQNIRLVNKDYDKINELLSNFGLIELREQLVSSLSGGEKQRLAIVRALIKEPSVILCDEPTSNLDDDNVEVIMTYLNNIKLDRTIIIITHDNRIDKYIDETIYMNQPQNKRNDN